MRALPFLLAVCAAIMFFAACASDDATNTAVSLSPAPPQSYAKQASVPADAYRPQAAPAEMAPEAARPTDGGQALSAPIAYDASRPVAFGQSSPAITSSYQPYVPPPPPRQPAPPHMMYFNGAGTNPRVETRVDPLSTFAVDVDTASYTIARNYLRRGLAPPPEAVRVEEFVNYFPDRYRPPSGEDFAVYGEMAPSPFAEGVHLLKIGIKGREIAEEERKPLVLTLLIDVSGSMEQEGRLELVKRTLGGLMDKLRADDRIGVAVYSTNGRKVLDHVSAEDRWKLEEALFSLRPEGSTNADEGLSIAYGMARRAYDRRAVNRVVLFSDGVANQGATNPDAMLSRVAGAAKDSIHLTVVGVGMGNYNDALLERLADKGNGHYAYIDADAEARRFLLRGLGQGLEVIAQDAKVQVAFNSDSVSSYRLIGFENRALADKDFRRDKVDAGEINAGHSVTALYEVQLNPGAESDELAKVSIRYKRPASGMQVKEISGAIGRRETLKAFAQAGDHFKLVACAAAFAEVLRNSWWAQRLDAPRVRDEFDRAFATAGASAERADLRDLIEAACRIQIARPQPEAPLPNDHPPTEPYDPAAPIPMKKAG